MAQQTVMPKALSRAGQRRALAALVHVFPNVDPSLFRATLHQYPSLGEQEASFTALREHMGTICASGLFGATPEQAEASLRRYWSVK